MAGSVSHKPDQFQQQAIASTSRGIRIVAPAGSGKSETLARRVAKRVTDDGVDPRRILVLTFDNAAKKSLTGFFGSLLDRRQMPQIRTFNSHGNSILKDLFPDEQDPIANTISSHEVRSLRDRFDAKGRSWPVLTWDGVNRPFTDVVLALKEQGFFPGKHGEYEKQATWLQDDYLRLPGTGETASLDDIWSSGGRLADDAYGGQIREILQAFVDYDKEMRKLKTMDWIDQKSRAVYQLWRSKAALTTLQSQFDEIVVDECQDISRLDAMLVYYSAGPDTLVVLAGDDDQTLYEWRNAHSLYLRKPEIVFKDIAFETIHLNLNYRSPQEILGPAVKLIGHNVERIEKSPSSGVRQSGEISIRPLESSRQIETDLVEQIRAEIRAGRNPQDIAVLCHARSDRDQKTPIENALRAAGIPVAEENSDRLAKPGVSVLGFLKAKGRQWPVIIIPAANDRDVPDNESVRKGEVESLRRRFYVAMTRASEKLIISYVRAGTSDRMDVTGEGEVLGTNGASRFLFEAGLVQDARPEEQPELTDSAPVASAPATASETAAKPEPQERANVVAPPTPSPQPRTSRAEPATPPPPAQTQKIADSKPVAQPHAQQTKPLATPPPLPAEPTPRRKGKLKDWEPRVEETRSMEKARIEWEDQDYDFAVLRSWRPIEQALKRMVKLDRSATPHGELVTLIDTALERRIIDVDWKNRLHLWRQVRNQANHEDGLNGRFTPDRFRDVGYQMVTGTPEFFAFLAQRNAPRQMALETQDEMVQKLSSLVTKIQQGTPMTRSGKRLAAIRFHPERDLFEVLGLQLTMVLRDVRFYVPEEYRWSHSPIVSKFCVDAIGHIPNGFHTSSGSRLKLQSGEELNQLLARFDRIVQQECGEVQAGLFLRERVEDGIRLQNGNFHAGIKLNPRAPQEQAAGR